jgi:hypothetical protein
MPARAPDGDSMNGKPSCLGGWCKVRDRCGDHLRDDREEVCERICAPGKENPSPIDRIDVVQLATFKPKAEA